MQKTYTLKKKELHTDWHYLDAEGEVLGRFASRIAVLLTGKNKSNYSPNLNCGDKVIVVNSKKIKITGKKEENKMYYKHSGMVGKLREKTAGQVRKQNPNRIIYEAVKGMLPKNRLRDVRLANLYIYEGEDHPHQAQVKGKENAKKD